MRFQSITLTDIGAFSDLSLCFLKSQCSDLHILFGRNEAGKSTLHRALLAALFDHYPSELLNSSINKAAINFSIEYASGSVESCSRFLKRSSRSLKTLQITGDDTVSQRRLMMDTVGRETFRFICGVDHSALLEGSRELLKGKGTLKELLFGQASGLRDISSLLRSLDEEAQALYKKNGKNPEINRILKEISVIQRDLRASVHTAAQWENYRQLEQEAQARVEAVEREYEQLLTQRTEKERLLRTRESLLELISLRDRVSKLPVIKLTREDCAEFLRICDAGKDISEALQRIKVNQEEMLRELTDIDVREDVLQQSSLIARLREQVSQEEARLLEIGKDRIGLEENKEVLERLLLECGVGEALPDPDRTTYLVGDLQSLLVVVREDTQLQGEIRAVRASHQEIIIRLRDIEGSLAEICPIDEQSLKHIRQFLSRIETLHQTGELLQAELQQLGDKVNRKASTLSAWRGTSLELRELTLPSRRKVEEFLLLQNELQREAALFDQQVLEAKKKLDEIKQKLEEAERDAPTWSRKDLQHARAERDRMIGEISDLGDDDFSLTKLQNQIGNLQILVQRADEIGDLLARDYQKVIKLESIRQKDASLSELLADLNTKRADQRAKFDTFESEWSILWERFPVILVSPQEMLTFYDEFSGIKNILSRMNELEQLVSQRAEDLSQTWGQISSLVALSEMSIAALQAEVQHQESLRGRREELIEQRKRALRESREKGVLYQDLQERSDVLRSEWKRRLSGIFQNLPELPQEIEVRLEQLVNVLKDVDIYHNSRRRLEKNIQLSDRYEQQLTVLARELHVELQSDQIREALTVIGELDRKAHDAMRRRQELLRQQERYQLEEHRCLERRQRLDQEQGQLYERCQIATQEEMFYQASLLEERETHLFRLKELERLLGREQVAIEVMIQQVEEADSSLLEVALATVGEQVEGAAEDLRNALRDLGKYTEQRQQFELGNDYLILSQKAESRYADLLELVEHYTEVTATRFFLQRAMEQHRLLHQQPVLDRTAKFFKILTDQRYEAVYLNHSEGSDLMLEVKNSVGELSDIGTLSDGTRDQLFLALRLAVLNDNLDTDEWLPLFLDDILINFDDDRTLCALKLCIEVARSRQVLLFTHHEYVLRQAQLLAEQGELTIHHVDSSSNRSELSQLLAS
jgi:uncharacterized protein YhaN